MSASRLAKAFLRVGGAKIKKYLPNVQKTHNKCGKISNNEQIVTFLKNNISLALGISRNSCIFAVLIIKTIV